LDSQKVTAVVCESYVITRETLRKTRGENWSLEEIGALRWLCRQHDVLFQLQSPSEGKSFGTDAKLEAVRWRYPTRGGHQDDAARHLLTYLWKSGGLRTVDRDRVVSGVSE
ncbi:MAG: hypothetical protein ACRDH5_09440, partial [bacterium]